MEQGATTHRDRPDQAGFAITVAFELVEGALARFHSLVSDNAAQSVLCEPGCVRFDVLTPANSSADEVLLYEIYTDRAAFDIHLASAHFKAFDDSTRELVRKKTVAMFLVAQNAKEGPTA